VKRIDHLLQRWRIAKARPYVPLSARLLDIGCARGELLTALGDRLEAGVGLDPDLTEPVTRGRIALYPGVFPDDLPPSDPFDVVTMLAVLEHVPASAHPVLVARLAAVLRPGGRVVITVPEPAVDPILLLLKRLRLIDGIRLEEHTGFAPADTLSTFTQPMFRLVFHRRFQLGLNHLYVFERLAETDTGPGSAATDRRVSQS
jgi:SAM-dependent methyltransferase